MFVVYVSGPFRAGTNYYAQEQNIRAAESVGLEVAKAGMVPLIPHTMYRFFQGALPDAFWLEGTLRLVRHCQAVILVGNYMASLGALAEKEEAEKYGIPVLGTLDALYEWKKDKEFSEFLPTSSGTWTTETIAFLAKEVADLGHQACSELANYMDCGKPLVVSKDNALRIFDFLLSIQRNETDILAQRLRDTYLTT
jgi:hypothetical protein